MSNIIMKERFVLSGSIDMDTTQAVVSQLLEWEEEGAERNAVTIIINSDGGNLTDAFAIIDSIKMSRFKVTTVGIGEISSAGAMILLAGDVRYMTDHAILMLHEPRWIDSGSERLMGKRTFLDFQERLHGTVLEYLEEKSGESRAYWQEVLREDFHMFAEEALSLGLIEGILKDWRHL